MKNVAIFSLGVSEELTKKVCKRLKLKQGDVLVKHFADGELIVEYQESVRNKDIYIIHSTSNPVSNNIMELLIAIDAAKRASAKSINVVIPYFGYARQDRKARPRQPITGSLVAKLIETAGATSVVTVEIHSSQTMGFFQIPADDLTTIGILAGYFKKNKILEDIVVVSPDHGGVKRARDLAEILGCPIAIIDKRRVVANQAEAMNLIGEVDGKIAIVIDDMIDTGGTLVSGIKMLKDKGAKEIYCAITHPVLSDPAIERISNSEITKLICTDTIELPEEKKISKIEVVSISNMIADVIKGKNNGDSLTRITQKYRDLKYDEK